MNESAEAARGVGALLDGDPGALARAISEVERASETGRALLAAIQAHLGRARVVGFTGVPGAGKSTLVSRYVGVLRRGGHRVGVVAVDPSSPFSGGAVLGDRIRLAEHACDEGVFVRSLASRGHAGGLAPTATQVVDLMDAAGWDRIVVETVGTGQGEIDVADSSDVCVVVCAPGLGDDVQTLKAGILEIAEVLVVNKGDLAGAQRTYAQLQSMLALRSEAARDVDVCTTIASTGEGVDALASLIEARLDAAEPGRARSAQRMRRQLAAAAGHLLTRELRDRDAPWLSELCTALQRGELDLQSAARRVLSSGKLADE
ncbi:MAG: methylmalonyl Co-A mutase-associated GTPase MeaB [Gammaproteobacteria bacterium]|nr:methylmalonyl Co-A mutase-associated GTPase MeaB [Gammaproteobacteria bacterium]